MLKKRTKKIKDTSSLNQIQAASKEMISSSPIPIELAVTDKVEIASYSITITSSHQELWIANRKVELNPQGVYQSYIQLCHTLGKATFSLEQFTIVIIAHEIGHGLCPIFRKHMLEHNEHELNDPYTKVIHEISAWKHCLPIIPRYIRHEDVIVIAEQSIKSYITALIGEKAVPVFLDYFKNIVG